MNTGKVHPRAKLIVNANVILQEEASCVKQSIRDTLSKGRQLPGELLDQATHLNEKTHGLNEMIGGDLVRTKNSSTWISSRLAPTNPFASQNAQDKLDEISNVNKKWNELSSGIAEFNQQQDAREEDLHVINSSSIHVGNIKPR